MADDKVLWFEKVGCKCQDFICVRRSMIVMNFCGEPETERNRIWWVVRASSTSQSLQSLLDFICTVLSFPIIAIPHTCVMLTKYHSHFCFFQLGQWSSTLLNHSRTYILDKACVIERLQKVYKNRDWLFYPSHKTLLIHNVDGAYLVT